MRLASLFRHLRSLVLGREEPPPFPPRPATGIPEFDPAAAPRPTFLVGVGRSGTHFFHELMRRDPSIASFHLDTRRTTIADSFVQYCLWNELPVDPGAFLADRLQVIGDAASEGRVYFEANPYLALSVRMLNEHAGAKFMLLTRDPRKVVDSHVRKGWYRSVPFVSAPDKATGFQPFLQANHAFGRLAPRGTEFLRWKELTQIGRISWYWNALNLRILEQFDALPAERRMIVAVEGVDYRAYRMYHSWIGGTHPLTQRRFSSIRTARPGKGLKRGPCSSWSDQEQREFLAETQPAREALSAFLPPAIFGAE